MHKEKIFVFSWTIVYLFGFKQQEKEDSGFWLVNNLTPHESNHAVKIGQSENGIWFLNIQCYCHVNIMLPDM